MVGLFEGGEDASIFPLEVYILFSVHCFWWLSVTVPAPNIYHLYFYST